MRNSATYHGIRDFRFLYEDLKTAYTRYQTGVSIIENFFSNVFIQFMRSIIDYIPKVIILTSFATNISSLFAVFFILRKLNGSYNVAVAVVKLFRTLVTSEKWTTAR